MVISIYGVQYELLTLGSHQFVLADVGILSHPDGLTPLPPNLGHQKTKAKNNKIPTSAKKNLWLGSPYYLFLVRINLNFEVDIFV